MKKALLWLTILLVFPLAQALDCSGAQTIAENYALANEATSYWGEVHLDKESSDAFCVFTYSNSKSDVSEITIIHNDRRLSSPLDDAKIAEVSFGFYTKNFLDKQYAQLENSFDKTYDEFRIVKELYQQKYDTIKTAVSQTIIRYVDICIDVRVKICASEELKSLLVEKWFGFLRVPDWDGTVNRFSELRGTTLELSGDNVIYSGEIETFYKNAIAIKSFLGAVDTQIGTNIHTNLGAYDFIDIGNKNQALSNQQATLIKARVDARRAESERRRTELEATFNSGKTKIKSAISTGKLISNQKTRYCELQFSMPSDSLLISEEFKSYDTSIQYVSKEISSLLTEVDAAKQDSSGPFNYKKIGWWWNSLWVC